MKKLHYIAIEGVIGVGKTSLAKLLAEKMNALLLMEKPEENPFLQDFYRDRKRFAFQTQLFFLLSRFKQQEEFPHPDLFHRLVVSDYIFPKDRIFASVNLDEREFQLYEKVAGMLEAMVPVPDLVVYLQSSARRLLRNIHIRGRNYEAGITEEYIEELNETYNQFFLNYNSSPLLIVNSENIDFVENENHLRELISAIETPVQGTKYYNPLA